MSNELSNVAVALPSGEGFGWGHCGRELTKRLVAKGAVTVNNSKPYIEECDQDLLQAISGREFGYTANIIGWTQYGYGFIEDDIIGRKNLPLAERLWDGIISGSTWMDEWVREYRNGQLSSGVVIQGIDTDIFHYREPKSLDAPFTIGSFGKLEFRKGQDIVIKAFGLFQEKHPEVRLLYAWDNQWPHLISQMAAEPELKCRMSVGPDSNWNRAYAASSALSRVAKDGSFHGVSGNGFIMRDMMETCDVALFPNRAEGGSNLFLHENLAVGTPCIATNATGHKDLTGRIDYPCKDLNLNCGKTFVYKQGDLEVGNWHEACLDEILSNLELAYQQREALRARRKEISAFGMGFSWDKSADKMSAILKGY